MPADSVYAAYCNDRDFGTSRWQLGSDATSASRVSGRGVATFFFAMHMSALGPGLPTRHAQVHGSYRTNTGNVILALSISAGDPKQKFITGNCCSARGSYDLDVG